MMMALILEAEPGDFADRSVSLSRLAGQNGWLVGLPAVKKNASTGRERVVIR
jgi:hypothetical protein